MNKSIKYSVTACVLALGIGGASISLAQDRQDWGYGGAGGANLEAYSKEHPQRAGEFKIIYGGQMGQGGVLYTHYAEDRPTRPLWVDMVKITAEGDVIARGSMQATEMIVDSEETLWPDYVFQDDYSLLPIEQLQSFIKENGHLPGVPTASEVKSNGHDLGYMSIKTLEKVEELALYVIQLKEENEALKEQIVEVRSTLNNSR